MLHLRILLVENGTLTAIGTKNGTTVTSQIVMAGEPARIVITSSHKKLPADRSSVAIISADIADSNGNHVYGACNSVKWTITGPASFVGPSTYESDILKHHSMEGIWYMDMPVSNVIRSTGLAGKIHITVSASGLASGSIDIEAEDIKPDNPVISEPVLNNSGRKKVERFEAIPTSRLEVIPKELKFTNDELKFNSPDKSGYSRLVS